MQIYFSLLVALIGVLMYALCVNGKLQEIGRIMFQCGLLAFLLTSAGPLIKLLGKIQADVTAMKADIETISVTLGEAADKQ